MRAGRGHVHRSTTSGRCVALGAALVLAVGMSAAPASARTGPNGVASQCTRPLVAVHDLVSSAAEWVDWTDPCVVAVEYGAGPATRILGPPVRVGGVAAIEESAADIETEIAAVLNRTGADAVDVVARGAGALVVHHALTRPVRGAPPPVRTLVSLGPLWAGTEVLGLAAVADVNRRLGIYEALAAVERPLVAPFCVSCGQVVARSSFLRSVSADPAPGVRYVDIVTTTDGIAAPAAEAVPRGRQVLVLQDVEPTSAVDHGGLTRDAVVRRLAFHATRQGDR
ncbi:esterase/lipase family protein [Rhodococcoides kroppenstedtii]|uniref:esterase/lipase family protein n=1 Tax=Rhodococcoides kroppenstedtii TaxID=293050 RepID=UPI0028EECA0F|nr:hypothetical protein [Rhodococcus kroppenstedtii]